MGADDYDLAGFAVGAVERDEILPLPTIRAGDTILGLESSGLHSNGFSLVRKIVDKSNLSYSDPAPWDASTSLADALLIPTIIYIRQLLAVLRDPKLKGFVKGLANITGGGFVENIPRVFPKGVGCEVDASSYDLPPVFRWLKKEGNVEAIEMARAFNCGIGMVVVVAKESLEEVERLLAAGGTTPVRLGSIEPRGAAPITFHGKLAL